MTRIAQHVFPVWRRMLVFLLVSTPQMVRADDASTPEQEAGTSVVSESLDDELLRELEEGPSSRPSAPGDAIPKNKSAETEPADDSGDLPELDAELMRELGEAGEQGQAADPLSRVGQTMREVEGRLSRSRAGEQTRELQSKIVADLDQMIQEALQRAQRSQSQSSSKSGQQGSQRSKVNQPQQQGQEQGGRGHQQEQPASDSTEQLGRDQVVRPDPGEVRDVMKHLWGHLPEREREMMLNASIEQFLPKYELLIEQYFRRLAEEQQGK